MAFVLSGFHPLMPQSRIGMLYLHGRFLHPDGFEWIKPKRNSCQKQDHFAPCQLSGSAMADVTHSSQLPEFSMNENPLKRAALYFLDLVNG